MRGRTSTTGGRRGKKREDGEVKRRVRSLKRGRGGDVM